MIISKYGTLEGYDVKSSHFAEGKHFLVLQHKEGQIVLAQFDHDDFERWDDDARPDVLVTVIE